MFLNFSCTISVLTGRILLWLVYPSLMKKLFKMTTQTMVVVARRKRGERKENRAKRRRKRKGGRLTVIYQSKSLVGMKMILTQSHLSVGVNLKAGRKAPLPSLPKKSLPSQRCPQCCRFVISGG